MKFPFPGHAPWAWSILLCASLSTWVWPIAAQAQAASAAPVRVEEPSDTDDDDTPAERERARTQRAAAAATPRFEIDMQAPEAIGNFLLRHMEVQRYRELRNLDANELGRLLVLAPANVRELLATLGHFSPQVEVIPPAGLGEAATDADDAERAPRTPFLGTVVVKIAPGPVTQIELVNISFVGDIATAPEAAEQRADIQREAGLIAGLPFSQADWNSTKTAALRALTAKRYPLGRVQNSLADIDAEAHQARLYIELDSGRAMRMGDVVVQGAERYDAITAQRLVRLAGLTEGSDYDLAKLQDAQRRLAETGYYDSAFVYVEPTADGETLPVQVQLREAKRQKVVIGIGGSTDNGARLSFEHIHNQVPGIGWRAVSKIQLEREDQLASTDWSSIPNNDGWRKIVGGQLAKQTDDFTTTTSQRLRAGQTQLGVEFDRSFYLQYDRARVKSSLLAPAAQDDAKSSITANYAWTRRRFDDMVFPNRGYGLAVEVGAGYTLGSDRQPFARTQARWLTYWPLGAIRQAADPVPGQARDVGAPGRRTQLGRLALRVEGGAVVARDSAPIPDTQLFITGGDNTVRGYGLRDIGVPRADGTIGPGRYKGVVSLEWQRPIFNADQRSNWENVLFIDGGAIANKAGDLKPVWGVGTGIRYNSPVGPLQLDLAYGLETRRFRIHLNVGFTF
ncbi:autotransporter assembly complex protein TamA [Hydrogenophaga sp. BPS33]|uniref:autotransporter assembly complex protein TamA n=1 Tax=Hydrogenophaga sp. BPS33 TaxID=2651974 RepID=UPI0013201AC0|nr:BamA/TamA family outer membrane protein [Hydrogenophaga sp. BPS33]QHE87687.1 BamA/TamA family outer membrane protein [Hydrogenophaga sp. BPS33]